MLVFFVLSFLLLASPIIESELLLNTSTLINSNESSLGMLASDTTVAAAKVEAFGRGVLIKSTGTAELILKDRTLKIKADIAEQCIGHVQICFPYSDGEESLAKKMCNPGHCAFNIKSNKTDVDFIRSNGGHKTCDAPIHMQKGRKTDYCGVMDWGCDPLMDGNGKIAIEVTYMTYTCSVFIDNAEIAPPPTTPSVPLIARPSADKTANASQPWYAWLILAIAILFLFALIVGIILCWRKKIVFFKNSGSQNAAFMDSHAARIVPKSAIVKEKSKVADAEVKAKKADKKQKKEAKKEKSLKTAQEATLEAKTPPTPPPAAVKPAKAAHPPPVPAKTDAAALPIHDYHEFEAPQELQRKINRQEQERQQRIRFAAMQPQLLPGDICKPHPSRRSSIRPPFPKPPPSRHQKQRKRRSETQETRESSTEES